MIRKSLLGIVKHVWRDDPALDKSDPDKFEAAWTAFLADGDAAKLPVKEGQKVAEFDLAPLSRRQFLRVYQGGGSPLEQMAEAVAYGLRALRGFEVDGHAPDLERVESDVGKRLSVKSLDAIFDPVLFAELGSRIVEISRIPSS